MATFVEITPDPFASNIANIRRGIEVDRADPTSGSAQALTNVRRPVRGIEIKNDTYATIQVRQANGNALPLFDAASSTKAGTGDINSNFLIQSIAEQRAEKQQIVMTFGEPYIFFFGEQPRVITVSGVLLNTADFNWRAEWWENYNLYLRGTACVRSRSRVYLAWDDIIVEGYLMTSSAQESSTEQNYVRFEFQMFLTNYQNISNVGNSSFRQAYDVNLEEHTEFVNSLGSATSNTRLVRELNVDLAERLAGGSGKDSLLSSLRLASAASAFQAGTNRLMEIQGQVVDILAEAGRFMAGRNIRVPIGFEGSTVYDDAQVALASLPGAQDIVLGTNSVSRSVKINRTLGGRPFMITGSLGQRYLPAKGTGHLYENEDEFVARLHGGAWGNPAPVYELHRNQKADAFEAMNQAEKVFEDFGVSIEVPDEMRLLFRRAMFGIVSIGAGMILNDSPAVRGYLTTPLGSGIL